MKKMCYLKTVTNELKIASILYGFKKEVICKIIFLPYSLPILCIHILFQAPKTINLIGWCAPFHVNG